MNEAKQPVRGSTKDIALKDIDPEIRSLILSDHPDYTENTSISFKVLSEYRLVYLGRMVSTDSEMLSDLNSEVLKSIKDNESITKKTLSSDADEKLTLGQRAADKIALFGGSWPFIIIFFVILVVWILVNSIALFGRDFDPYPFILLNLILSCLAAIQAPIIMMSQNRQAERDRKREVNDYKVNLKAEMEIELLHEKMDYFLERQWGHLMEVQTMQIELMQQLQEEPDQKS